MTANAGSVRKLYGIPACEHLRTHAPFTLPINSVRSSGTVPYRPITTARARSGEVSVKACLTGERERKPIKIGRKDEAYRLTREGKYSAVLVRQHDGLRTQAERGAGRPSRVDALNVLGRRMLLTTPPTFVCEAPKVNP